MELIKRSREGKTGSVWEEERVEDKKELKKQRGLGEEWSGEVVRKGRKKDRGGRGGKRLKVRDIIGSISV